MRVRARVPCSTSNLGAGFDCVGLALDRYLTAEWEPSEGPLRVERHGTLAALDGPDDLLVAAFERAAAARGARSTGVIRADSTIPIGRGLGSSAAAVVAGIALAAAAAGADAEPARLVEEAEAWEGHPDNVAPALLGGLVVSVHGADGRTRAMPCAVSPEIGFAYAAPAFGVSTKEARAALPAWVPHRVAVRALARLPALLRGLAEADADLLALGFADELHVPYRLGLIPGAETAWAASLEAGAWACTVSGAGSGLIAACPRPAAEVVAAAMASAFEASGGAPAIGFVAEVDTAGTRIFTDASVDA